MCATYKRGATKNKYGPEYTEEGAPLTKIIEVIAKKDQKIYKIINITIGEWKKFKRKPGWNYQSYQAGFSCFPAAKIIDYSKTKK